MNIVRFGSESEYIEIRLPASYSTEGWAQAEVQITVHCFSGAISPWVEKIDFEQFTTQLRALYESLQGEAAFTPIEEQFTFKLSAGSTGRVLLTGQAWSMATHENQLRFELQLDQSYLLAPLEALESLHGKQHA